MENSDDLRLFLAIARAGSSRGGAQELGINQSTISRRISQLESRSGVRLFDRKPTGLELTEAGEEMLGLADEVEANFDTLDRRLQGRDHELRGPVRLTLPDFLAAPVAAHLARFAESYPKIEIELMVDNGIVNLTHREADLALRFASSPSAHLVGRRIAPAIMAIYESEEYLSGHPKPIDPKTLDWIRWDEPWRGAPLERWIDEHIPPTQVRGRINTSLAHTELAAEGLGVGLMPCYLGDAEPRLARAGAPIDFGLSAWLLTHEDLKTTARVRTLMRYLGDALSEDRSRFLGEA